MPKSEKKKTLAAVQAVGKIERPRPKKAVRRLAANGISHPAATPHGPDATVLDRIWSVVVTRRGGDPAVSHSARLLSRGTAKVAQKFGEEAVECVIEAVAGNREALLAESADVLYHLIVLWVDAGVRPDEVWQVMTAREGMSGIAEKAARPSAMPLATGLRTRKIP
jgi:phosphoribosyl-ATP pyrophosphohydrolase